MKGEGQTLNILHKCDIHGQSINGNRCVRDIVIENSDIKSSNIAGRPQVQIQARPILRNITVKKCRFYGCLVGTAVFEDIEIIDCEAPGVTFFRGSVYKHVLIRGGSLGHISIKRTDFLEDQKKTDRLLAANLEYYRDVDWAFDIRDLNCKDFDFEGAVPVHLVRRDPDTQVIVTRARLLATQTEWQKAPLKEWTHFYLNNFLNTGEPATILVAPRRRRFQNHLHDIKLLREMGAVLPEGALE